MVVNNTSLTRSSSPVRPDKMMSSNGSMFRRVDSNTAEKTENRFMKDDRKDDIKNEETVNFIDTTKGEITNTCSFQPRQSAEQRVNDSNSCVQQNSIHSELVVENSSQNDQNKWRSEANERNSGSSSPTESNESRSASGSPQEANSLNGSLNGVSPVHSNSSSAGSLTSAHPVDSRSHSISSAPNGHIAISPSMLNLRPLGDEEDFRAPTVPRAPNDGLQAPLRQRNEDLLLNNDDNRLSPCSTVAPIALGGHSEVDTDSSTPGSAFAPSPLVRESRADSNGTEQELGTEHELTVCDEKLNDNVKNLGEATRKWASQFPSSSSTSVPREETTVGAPTITGHVAASPARTLPKGTHPKLEESSPTEASLATTPVATLLTDDFDGNERLESSTEVPKTDETQSTADYTKMERPLWKPQPPSQHSASKERDSANRDSIYGTFVHMSRPPSETSDDIRTEFSEEGGLGLSARTHQTNQPETQAGTGAATKPRHVNSIQEDFYNHTPLETVYDTRWDTWHSDSSAADERFAKSPFRIFVFLLCSVLMIGWGVMAWSIIANVFADFSAFVEYYYQYPQKISMGPITWV